MSVEVVKDANINEYGNLILIMSSGRQIDAGPVAKPRPRVVDTYVEGTSIIVEFNDGEKITAMDITDLGYKDVEEIYVDGYDVYARYIDGAEELVGNVLIETNSEIFATYINRDDGFIYGVRYNGEIETIGSMEEYIGDRLSENIVEIKSNDLEEVILVTENNEYNIGKIYYKNYNNREDKTNKEILNIYLDPESNVIKVRYRDGSEDEVGRSKYVSINGTPIVLANASVNEIGNLNLEVLKVDNNGNFVMTQEPEYFEDGTVSYRDVFETELIDAGHVKGEDGIDGTIFESVDVFTDGMLVFTTTEGVRYNAGYLMDRSIVDAYIDEEGVLVLVLSDESEIRTSNVLGKDGEDGENITKARIDEEGMLWLGFDDDAELPEIPAGVVRNPIEVSVYRDSDDHIIFRMSDGTEIDAGIIPGVKSRYITDMENREGEVYVKYSDDREDADWHHIGSISYVPSKITTGSNGHLQIEFSDGTVVESDRHIYGKDGDTLLGIDMDGNDLVVRHTEDNRAKVTEKRFEGIRGANIEEIRFDDRSHSLQFIKDNGESHYVLIPIPEDGVGIRDIRKEGLDLVFELTNGNTEVIEGVVGEGLHFERADDEGLYFTNTVTQEEVFVALPKAVDGDGITNVRLEDNILYLDFKERETEVIELPVGTNQHKTIKDITFDEVTTEIVITFEDEDEEIRYAIPRPRDGDTLTAAYVDQNNNLVFEFNSLEEPVRFPMIVGKDANSIEDITYDASTKELVIKTSDENESRVKMPSPRDGISLIDISESDGVLTFTFSDSSTQTVDLRYGEDGLGIDDITFDNDSDALRISLTDGSEKEFPVIRGLDGRSITDITYDGEKIEIYIDGEVETTIPFRTGIDGTKVTDVYIDGQDLVVETDIEEGNGFKTARFELLRGVDGKDGVGVTNMYIDPQKDLIVNLSNGEEKRLPKVGLYVNRIALDDDGRLVIHYNDGTSKTTPNRIKGRDGEGRGITDISVVGNQLKLVVSDATGNDEEFITNLNVKGVSNTLINDDGELIFVFTDGTTKNVGRVDGVGGRWIKSASVSTNGRLTVVVTDGNTDQTLLLGNVRGEDGRHVTDISADSFSGDLTVTYSDSNTQVVGNIKDDRSVTVWSSDATPYAQNRVVLHNGSLFIANTSTSTTPPSGNWREIAFNDQLSGTIPPKIVYPVNNSSIQQRHARLTVEGSPFIAIGVTRKHRTFILKDASDTELHRVSTNEDSITVYVEQMTYGSVYTWEIFDTMEDDTISPSSTVTFYIESVEYVPNIVLAEGLVDECIPTPEFKVESISSDNGTGSNISVLTTTFTWMVENSEGVIIHQEDSIGGLYQLPYGILAEDSEYRITCRYNNTTSNSLVIHTHASYDYMDKPQISYDGEDVSNVSTTNATFVCDGVARISPDVLIPEYIFLANKIEKYYWEVINTETNAIVMERETENASNHFSTMVYLDANADYAIRVKVSTSRFGETPWSNWLHFSAKRYIEKPALSTDESINNFNDGGKVVLSEPVAVNTNPNFVVLEVLDQDSGHQYYRFRDPLSELEIPIQVTKSMAGKSVYMRVRYESVDSISEWSDVLAVRLSNSYSQTLYVLGREELSGTAYNRIANGRTVALEYDSFGRLLDWSEPYTATGAYLTHKLGSGGILSIGILPVKTGTNSSPVFYTPSGSLTPSLVLNSLESVGVSTTNLSRSLGMVSSTNSQNRDNQLMHVTAEVNDTIYLLSSSPRVAAASSIGVMKFTKTDSNLDMSYVGTGISKTLSDYTLDSNANMYVCSRDGNDITVKKYDTKSEEMIYDKTIGYIQSPIEVSRNYEFSHINVNSSIALCIDESNNTGYYMVVETDGKITIQSFNLSTGNLINTRSVVDEVFRGFGGFEYSGVISVDAKKVVLILGSTHAYYIMSMDKNLTNVSYDRTSDVVSTLNPNVNLTFTVQSLFARNGNIYRNGNGHLSMLLFDSDDISNNAYTGTYIDVVEVSLNSDTLRLYSEKRNSIRQSNRIPSSIRPVSAFNPVAFRGIVEAHAGEWSTSSLTPTNAKVGYDESRPILDAMLLMFKDR